MNEWMNEWMNRKLIYRLKEEILKTWSTGSISYRIQSKTSPKKQEKEIFKLVVCLMKSYQRASKTQKRRKSDFKKAEKNLKRRNSAKRLSISSPDEPMFSWLPVWPWNFTFDLESRSSKNISLNVNQVVLPSYQVWSGSVKWFRNYLKLKFFYV